MIVDWFETLTGFRETGYAETRQRLEVSGGKLRSRVNEASFAIRHFELASLHTLRERIKNGHFTPFPDGEGQTAHRQLDGLAELGDVLSRSLATPVAELWTMQNGYALATQLGLEAINLHLATLSPADIDVLRSRFQIGLHSDVEVTEAPGPERPLVSQAFCSALPVAYSPVPSALWGPFARLVLEAAYEATLRAAVLNAQRGASNVVFLTLLGGGAFGNSNEWIYSALRRALGILRPYDLDVRLVSYGAVTAEMSVFIGSVA